MILPVFRLMTSESEFHLFPSMYSVIMMNDECRNGSMSVAYATATVRPTTISPAIDPRLGQRVKWDTTVGNALAYDCNI